MGPVIFDVLLRCDSYGIANSSAYDTSPNRSPNNGSAHVRANDNGANGRADASPHTISNGSSYDADSLGGDDVGTKVANGCAAMESCCFKSLTRGFVRSNCLQGFSDGCTSGSYQA